MRFHLNIPAMLRWKSNESMDSFFQKPLSQWIPPITVIYGCQPKNRGGPPKSWILIGVSIIFTIHFGISLFLGSHRKNSHDFRGIYGYKKKVKSFKVNWFLSCPAWVYFKVKPKSLLASGHHDTSSTKNLTSLSMATEKGPIRQGLTSLSFSVWLYVLEFLNNYLLLLPYQMNIQPYLDWLFEFKKQFKNIQPYIRKNHAYLDMFFKWIDPISKYQRSLSGSPTGTVVCMSPQHKRWKTRSA